MYICIDTHLRIHIYICIYIHTHISEMERENIFYIVYIHVCVYACIYIGQQLDIEEVDLVNTYLNNQQTCSTSFQQSCQQCCRNPQFLDGLSIHASDDPRAINDPFALILGIRGGLRPPAEGPEGRGDIYIYICNIHE